MCTIMMIAYHGNQDFFTTRSVTNVCNLHPARPVMAQRVARTILSEPAAHDLISEIDMQHVINRSRARRQITGITAWDL